jgi:enamine deaminase RidA (YjgF/YER057c/UK114 family)
MHPGDTYRQARAALERALAALGALGGSPRDVLRTRLYLAPGADWHGAARAHAELLGEVAPANTTLYVAGMVGDGFLVEVEVDAELAEGPP